jgi:3'5'-cyclic nucleotide phosphodiesterase
LIYFENFSHTNSPNPLPHSVAYSSALIHDADHPGVPNSTLINEGDSLAATYSNKSIAEQNSVDLAWDLLMQDDYLDLRRTIYTTKDDMLRFRQLVVNIVMATE